MINLRHSVKFEDYFSPQVQRANGLISSTETAHSVPNKLTCKEIYFELFQLELTNSFEYTSSIEEIDEKISSISQPLFTLASTEVSSPEKLLYQEIPLQILEQNLYEQTVSETPVETKPTQKVKKTPPPKARSNLEKKIRKVSRNQTWTTADDEVLLTSLRRNIDLTGKKNWQRISADLNHEFSYKACHRRFERKWLLLNRNEQFWLATSPIKIIANHRTLQVKPLEASTDINKYQVFIKEKPINISHWILEEDRLLLEGIEQFGQQWITIYKEKKLYNFSRTPDDCFKRYKYLVNKGDPRITQTVQG